MAGRRKKTVTVDEGSSPILPESDNADTPAVTDDSASSVSQETSPPGSPDDAGVLAGPPVPASPPSEQPAAGNSQSEKISDERLIAEIRNIVCVPRVRGAIPSLVKYREGYLERYFFLDVDGELLRKAWSLYKVNAADPNPAAFTHLVINLLEAEFPRIYRAVTFVPLS